MTALLSVFRWACVLLVVSTTACATSLRVSDISQAQPNTFVDGIPFRIRETQMVVVYRRTGEGAYEEVFRRFEDLPNMDELYALNLHGSAFSSGTLATTISPDSTLAVSNLSGELHGDDAFLALGDQVQNLSQSIAEYELERTDIARRVEESRTTRMTMEFSAEYRRAFRRALAADDDFASGAGTYTEADVVALKQDANRWAKLAGKSPPFSDVD